ncbi:MAG: phage protease [Desulfovibrio piger]|uniref:phage protease n=1 Tax=Desulfovibrio piger TaxID=901 RepID=UPI0039912205
MDKKWIEIARTGTFTDSSGRPQTFTERDLAAIASAYDPTRRDAPLTFGHPASDSAPAFGWAEQLKSEGGKLFARFRDVPEKVRELVAGGHYRHVSMSLMPDRVSLRHVALLGAAQPAIDGLAAVEFADGGDAITVDFAAAVATKEATDGDSKDAAASGEGDIMTVEELQRQVGQLTAQLEALKTENASLKKQAETSKQDREKAESAKADAEKKAEKAGADFAAYREKVEGERREARVAELVKAGKVKPAEKAGVLDFAAKLAAQGGTVDFAAPDGGTESLSLEERYFRDLEARPADERGAEFSAPPAHAGGRQDNINPAELTAKL